MDAALIAAGIMVAAACGWAAESHKGKGRLAWSLLGLAALLWGASRVPAAAEAFSLGGFPGRSALGEAHLTAELASVAACLLLVQRVSGSSIVESVLDALIVVGSLLFVSLMVVSVGHWSGGPGESGFAIAANLATDVAVLSVAFFAVARAHPLQRLPTTLLALGVGISAIGDSLAANVELVANFSVEPLAVAGSLAGLALLLAAAVSARRRPLAFAPSQPARSSLTLLLPYLPVVLVAVAAIAYAAFRGEMSSFLLWNLIVVGLFVFARQVVALLRNFSLAQRLDHELRYDPLTGLPNRLELREQLQSALGRAATNEGVALLIIDLDHFKRLTDTLGDAAGDALLKLVGARLRQVVRRPLLSARIGGDEFAVLASNTDRPSAIQIAKGLLCALGEPLMVEDQSLEIGASIGVAIFPEHGRTAADILRRADAAMYVAKRTRHAVAIYDPSLEESIGNPLALMGELRAAIRTGQLFLQYQPVVNTKTGTVSHVEALVRWQHPQRGLVPPSEFIPFAEDSGLIEPLTEWVLATALGQARSWREQGMSVDVAVNLSVRNLLDGDLDARIADLIQRAQAQAQWLRLEITETAIMSDPKRSVRTLGRLRGIGIRLSIDDFGTGYSSLAQLQRLPVDELKIDRSFVSALVNDPNSQAIVRAALDLGHSLKLACVAEGVESAQTADLLTGMGCDAIQGYYVCPPIGDSQLLKWNADWTERTKRAA